MIKRGPIQGPVRGHPSGRPLRKERVRDAPYLSYRDEPRVPSLRRRELKDAIGFGHDFEEPYDEK